MHGARASGSIVGWWIGQVIDGDPTALVILFFIVVFLIGLAAVKRFCDLKFGEYESHV